MSVDYSKMTANQWAALRAVRHGEGRNWKSALSKMWEAANYPGYGALSSELQYLRNASYFGPAGLRRLTPARLEETAL